MIMCFMSIPCCGCVSQAEWLTNCSILLNVRLMEAINGSALIAVTHLAPCYCVLQLKTHLEDRVLRRCWWFWIGFLVCGQTNDHLQKTAVALSALLFLNFGNTQQLALLSVVTCRFSHAEWHVRRETSLLLLLQFVPVCACILKEGSCSAWPHK